MCAKYSVSALTHRDDEFSVTDVSGAFEAVPSAVQRAQEKNHCIDPQLIGSATHLVFERLPLTHPVTAEIVAQTLATLVKDGLIPSAVAGQIDTAGIAAFFLTEPGQATLAAGKAALREWPFTLGVSAAALNAAAPNETVIVQGIIDLIIPTPAGLIVADFKTDRIRDDAALQQRTAHYCQPLGWYAQAASAILKKPIASSWLYFVDCRKAVCISG
jgi:ATP-dependent helicase/nuclease subunit A